ncbi:hypothetical protein HK098_002805 [Nowakowskiella sp. JEL0407]|nr:hypothetical protein HK098_002805 [Nowakowskiella sp. JEL0407]
MGNVTGREEPLGSEIELRHFVLLRCVGKGAFGRVRIVEKKDIKKHFALKYINKMQCIKMHAIQNIFRERAILEEINHPFMVNLRYAFQDDENMFMVLDLMIGGDLRYHLDRLGGFPEKVVRFYATELALAFRYLHSKGIAHRDIKPDNLLLDEFGHIHITDFNIAVHFTPSKMLKSQSGTLAYMAPEVFGNHGYLWEVDWWSLGVVLYECLYGKRPFRGANNEAVTHSICRSDLIIPAINLLTKQPVVVSQEGISAIRGFLTRDCKQRLGCTPGGFEDLQKHPWFNGVNWEATERKLQQPPFVPPSETANFDATYDLEELLLEDNPLTYGPKKKKKEKEKEKDADQKPNSGPYSGPSGQKSQIPMDGTRPIPKPPSNLSAKEKIQWELNFIEDNFRSFDSMMYEKYVGFVDPAMKRVSEPPSWVKNLDEALGPTELNSRKSTTNLDTERGTNRSKNGRSSRTERQTDPSKAGQSELDYMNTPSPELDQEYENVREYKSNLRRSKSLQQKSRKEYSYNQMIANADGSEGNYTKSLKAKKLNSARSTSNLKFPPLPPTPPTDSPMKSNKHPGKVDMEAYNVDLPRTVETSTFSRNYETQRFASSQYSVTNPAQAYVETQPPIHRQTPTPPNMSSAQYHSQTRRTTPNPQEGQPGRSNITSSTVQQIKPVPPISHIRPAIQQRQQSLDPHLQVHLQNQNQQLASLTGVSPGLQQPMSYFPPVNSQTVDKDSVAESRVSMSDAEKGYDY